MPFIKTLKFVQLTASNLVAITNLAICANLALIVHVSMFEHSPCSCRSFLQVAWVVGVFCSESPCGRYNSTGDPWETHGPAV